MYNVLATLLLLLLLLLLLQSACRTLVITVRHTSAQVFHSWFHLCNFDDMWSLPGQPPLSSIIFGNISCLNYASVRMCRRHTVAGLCVCVCVCVSVCL